MVLDLHIEGSRPVTLFVRDESYSTSGRQDTTNTVTIIIAIAIKLLIQAILSQVSDGDSSGDEAGCLPPPPPIVAPLAEEDSPDSLLLPPPQPEDDLAEENVAKRQKLALRSSLALQMVRETYRQRSTGDLTSGSFVAGTQVDDDQHGGLILPLRRVKSSGDVQKASQRQDESPFSPDEPARELFIRANSAEKFPVVYAVSTGQASPAAVAGSSANRDDSEASTTSSGQRKALFRQSKVRQE